MKKIAVLVLIAALLTGIFTVAFATGTVTTTGQVNLRTGPGLGYATIKPIPQGTSLAYLDQTKYDSRGVAWYYVRYGTSTVGWVSSVYATFGGSSSSSSAGGTITATGDVNLRTGPGLGYASIKTIKQGATMSYLGETQYDSRGVAWYHVRYGTSTEGWVSSVYATFGTWTGPSSSGGTITTTGEVNLRYGPGLEYGTVTSVSKGTKLTYLNQTKYDSRGVAWYYVLHGASTAGWVSSVYSTFGSSSSSSTGTSVYTTGEVNLRTGPGLGYGSITSIPKGTYLTYLNQTQYDSRGVAWYYARYGTSNVGWVSSVYSKLY